MEIWGRQDPNRVPRDFPPAFRREPLPFRFPVGASPPTPSAPKRELSWGRCECDKLVRSGAVEPRILLGLHSSGLFLVGWCCSLARTSTYQGTSARIGTLVGRRVVCSFTVARIGILVGRLRLQLRCRAGFLLFCMCASCCPLLCRRVGPRIQFTCIVATRYLLFPKQRLVCHSCIRTVSLPYSRFVAPLCCIFPSFLHRMRRNGSYPLGCLQLFFASFSEVGAPLFDQPRHRCEEGSACRRNF